MRYGRGFALFCGVIYCAAAEPAWAQTAAVKVIVHDSAAVDDATLSEARLLSAGIFGAAGIDTDIARSSESCPTAGPRFCIMVLLRPSQAQFQPGKARTMGVALQADANRAVVSLYLDAVVDVARRYGQPVGKVLGVALAHEMGHVLLPPPSHSNSGIMQPSWESDTLRHAIFGDIKFTSRQAETIRERLMNRRLAQ